MPIPPKSRCPGSGMHMVARTYVIRQIDESDREKHAWRLARAEERGDPEEVEAIKEGFERWERKQGQEDERMVCPICGDQWLVPTSKGTSRPHARREWNPPSWDRVRQVRKDIETLQAELDRVLEALETRSEPEQ